MVTLLIEGPHPRQQTPLIVVSKAMSEVAAFHHQVRWLTRASRHAVARIHRVDHEACSYSTRFEGPHTLATLSRDPGRCLVVVKRLWLAVERLHQSGLSHHSLRPEHVVVRGSAPILISPQRIDVGRAQPGGSEFRPDIDITHFGQLLSHLGELWRHDRLLHPEASEQWILAGRTIAGLTDAARPGSAQAAESSQVRRQLRQLDVRFKAQTRWGSWWNRTGPGS